MTRGVPWRSNFLKAFEKTGVVSYACKAAKVSRQTVYQERQRNEEFALAWADIELRTTEAMEREAIRRAAEGVDKPVFQGGKEVGTVREFSDTLLIFMLKARRPDVYRDRVDVNHSGSVGLDLTALSDDELRELADELDRKRAA